MVGKYKTRYAKQDAEALDEMKTLIGTGAATTPHNAAMRLAPKLKGASLESTVKRLARKFTAAFPNWNTDRLNWR